ncbi:hypothetical protein GW17_00042561 [Ensete ventricosum]|nr:hypothetical protein GW17_00042561 [Ensete ventricosum]
MLVVHAADDADLRLELALALPSLSFQSLDGDFSAMFELPFVQQSTHTLAEEEISVGEPVCCTRQFFVCEADRRRRTLRFSTAMRDQKGPKREGGRAEERGRERMPGSHDQRSRSAKAVTIHGCAQSGDLIGLQKRLQENPSLLNARNAVVRLLLLGLRRPLSQ